MDSWQMVVNPGCPQMSFRSKLALLGQLLGRPHEFFDERPPSQRLGLAMAIVLALSVVSAASIVVIGWLLSQYIDVTMTVTTLEPWPESTCDQFREMNNETNASSLPEPCTIDEPRTKQVHLGSKAYSIFAGRVPVAFLGVLFGWLLIAIGLHVVSSIQGGEGSFSGTLAVAGIGMAPSVFQTLAVTGAMGWAIATMEFGTSASMVTTQIQTVAGSVSHPIVWLVIVAVGIWQAWIWAAGLERARNLEPGDAKLTAGVIALIGILSSLT